MKFLYDRLSFCYTCTSYITLLVTLHYWLPDCYITENLELIEAGKAGPVGSPNEPPSPKQPIRDQKTAYLTTDVNILENGIGLEHELPDINFQVRDQ